MMKLFTRDKRPNIIKHINDRLFNELIEQLSDIQLTLQQNREKIDISECFKINDKICELRSLSNDAINDDINTKLEIASEAESTNFEEELRNSKLPKQSKKNKAY